VTTDTRPAIDRLLRPRSIAIVGVSPQPTSPATQVLGNIERFNYPATVHLVSRGRTEVLGRACVPTIDELPEGIDLVLLLVPGAAVLESMQACARRAVGAVVVYAAGFAELGEAGLALQQQVAAVAREAGIAMLGPNCLGFTNYLDGLSITFSPMHPDADAPPPSVAFVSQSGGTPTVVRFALLAKRIGLSYQITTGNEALLGVEDFLEPMLADDRNRVIATFCEEIRSPQRFLAAAAHARELRKPIVMLQPGSSESARASARSHTGALVGDHALARTTLEHAGVVVVDTMEELIDVTELLVRFPVVPARGPALITDSGAFKGVELDLCERIGLPVPPFAADTAVRLRAVLPDFVTTDNPVDVTAQALVDTQLYAKTIVAVADDAATGSTVCSGIFARAEGGMAKVRTMLEAFKQTAGTRPAIVAMLVYDAPVPEGVYAECADAGVAFFRSPERALRALERVTRYGAFLERPAYVQRKLPAPLALEPGIVTEHRAKALLRDAGVNVPHGSFVTDVVSAQRVAAEIGYPVVLKLQSPDLAHKTDAGALALNIADAAQLATAWDRLHANVLRARPGVVVLGALVEVMAKPGIEFIAGARRNAGWGTTLVGGLGGIWAETLNDTVLIPADADEDTIVAALQRLRAAPILAGTRGAPALDVRAAARALAALGRIIDSTPAISEIEINPLVLYPDGVTALDALIVVDAEA
jgi:acyl-CoA synthetase (NDP forming)